MRVLQEYYESVGGLQWRGSEKYGGECWTLLLIQQPAMGYGDLSHSEMGVYPTK